MSTPANHRQKGDKGEDLAEKFLENLGYTLLLRNFCIRGGEIDLIMHDSVQDQVVFVEVKTRYSHSKFGNVYESITPQKLSFIQRAIEQFFMKRGKSMYEENFRIDAVFIQMNAPEGRRVEHIKNAFSFDDFFDTMY